MKKKNNRGFTLVEVIVALVVTVMAVTIISQGFSVGGHASVVSQKRTHAVFLAQRVMTDVETEELPHNRTSTGEFEDRPDYSYEVETDTTEIADLHEITVKIKWTEREREQEYTLVRLLYRPAEEGSR